MANEVKFGYEPGYVMIFNAFQADGSGRGINNQPLPEIHNTGYYTTTPLTDLESKDFVIINEYNDLTFDSTYVYVLSYQAVTYDDSRVYYEENWIVDKDNTSNRPVRVLGDVLGFGEYTTVADDVSDLVQQGGSVTNIIDETGGGAGGGQVLTSLGNVGIHEGGDC